jgi:tyrosinase
MEVLTSADLAADFTLEDRGRRIFIKGVGLVGVGLLAGTLGGCDKLAEAIRNRPLRRRLRTGSAEVDAAIDLYRQAVTQMQGLAPANPQSWAAQAAIHGTPAGFNFCQHNTNHFFDWHRAYLFYFEKICQKLTGNSKFGLPYWNWNQDEAIHPAFLDAASVLFLPRTRTSMAGWNATTTPTLDPIMADTNLFSFSQQIEGTPHNSVHSYIGGTLGGYTSALDPLFWMHHCMVDYCWAKWNLELDNDNTNDQTWIGTEHSHFVDADGDPASVTAGVTTLMPLLSYRYESSAIGSSPAQAEAAMTKSQYKKLENRVRKGADVRFDIKRRVRLAERTAVSIARPLSVDTRSSAAEVASIVETEASREVVFASIEYAQLPATSDFSVRVFVNLPGADANTPDEDPHYAGSFAFFGTETAAAGAEHRLQPRFLVNLTPTLQRLRSRQELTLSGAISVQLVPTPFAGGFEQADTELVLNGIDIIVTPVTVRAKTV